MHPVSIEDIEIPSLPFNNFVEMWNPSLEDVKEISKYLHQQRKILLVWIYGPVKYVPDFSSLNDYRIVIPVYLGKTLEDALIVRDFLFKQLMNPIVNQGE